MAGSVVLNGIVARKDGFEHFNEGMTPKSWKLFGQDLASKSKSRSEIAVQGKVISRARGPGVTFK